MLGQVWTHGPIRGQLTALLVWIAAEMGPDLQQRQHSRLWSRLFPAHRRFREMSLIPLYSIILSTFCGCLGTFVLG